MSTPTSLPRICHTPDDLWSRLAPVFGPDKPPGTVGRPAVPARRVFDAVIYLLRTGCQWRGIPRETYTPCSTGPPRLRQWVAAGLFKQAWEVLLEHYDLELGIEWKWQALDGVITKAPLGGEAARARPVAR